MNTAEGSRRPLKPLAWRELVTDPVCGMAKPKSEMKVKSIYRGKTYYFCTEGDKDMFEAYPEHWIPKEARDRA